MRCDGYLPGGRRSRLVVEGQGDVVAMESELEAGQQPPVEVGIDAGAGHQTGRRRDDLLGPRLGQVLLGEVHDDPPHVRHDHLLAQHFHFRFRPPTLLRLRLRLLLLTHCPRPSRQDVNRIE